MISLFGKGFIGSRFQEMYKDSVFIESREFNSPKYNNVLYLISTTTNYNVFDNPTLDIETNLIKLIKVLENCKNKNITFNFISSWFVYGKISTPFKEDYICNPKGFYSITKKCAEDLLISYCQTFNINYRIFRLSNVYGPNDKFSKQKNALQYLINKIKNNEDIELYDNGNFIRDYLYIDDICRAITLCIDKAPLSEIINIGSGNPYKFKDLIDFTIKESGSKSKIVNIKPTDFHNIIQVKDAYLNIDKLSKLGFKQQIDIKEGIKRILR